MSRVDSYEEQLVVHLGTLVDRVRYLNECGVKNAGQEREVAAMTWAISEISPRYTSLVARAEAFADERARWRASRATRGR